MGGDQTGRNIAAGLTAALQGAPALVQAFRAGPTPEQAAVREALQAELLAPVEAPQVSPTTPPGFRPEAAEIPIDLQQEMLEGAATQLQAPSERVIAQRFGGLTPTELEVLFPGLGQLRATETATIAKREATRQRALSANQPQLFKDEVVDETTGKVQPVIFAVDPNTLEAAQIVIDREKPGESQAERLFDDIERIQTQLADPNLTEVNRKKLIAQARNTKILLDRLTQKGNLPTTMTLPGPDGRPITVAGDPNVVRDIMDMQVAGLIGTPKQIEDIRKKQDRYNRAILIIDKITPLLDDPTNVGLLGSLKSFTQDTLVQVAEGPAFLRSLDRMIGDTMTSETEGMSAADKKWLNITFDATPSKIDQLKLALAVALAKAGDEDSVARRSEVQDQLDALGFGLRGSEPKLRAALATQRDLQQSLLNQSESTLRGITQRTSRFLSRRGQAPKSAEIFPDIETGAPGAPAPTEDKPRRSVTQPPPEPTPAPVPPPPPPPAPAPPPAAAQPVTPPTTQNQVGVPENSLVAEIGPAAQQRLMRLASEVGRSLNIATLPAGTTVGDVLGAIEDAKTQERQQAGVQ